MTLVLYVPGNGEAMQEKVGLNFFIEFVVVVVLLGSLGAIAIPNVGSLISKGKVQSYESELHNIQTAVTQMLSESAAGTLKPVGPTADMSRVQTDDTPPLMLKDYLLGLEGVFAASGCAYTFAADGSVSQRPP